MPDRTRWAGLMLCLIATGLSASPAATHCAAASGEKRLPLLELYTSEGCSSCPPADRWVSGLLQRGLAPTRVAVLGFHVDYWDYLGWRDPFGQSWHSARQQAGARRAGARAIYTPQLLLDGRDYRRGFFGDRIEADLRAASARPARARIDLRAGAEGGALVVTAGVALPDRSGAADARLYLALYENNLSTEVKAGENRGRRLHHDFVVRSLAGPYAIDARAGRTQRHRFELKESWKRTDLHVTAFVQNERTGEVLQALTLGYCPAEPRAGR